MQKLVNGQWVDTTEAELTVGEQYRISVGGGWEQKAYSLPVVENPVVDITGVTITGATLNGNIYWAPKGGNISLQASGALPDGQLMLVIEKSVSAGSRVVDDTRIIVDIANGVLTASFSLPATGNWFVTAARVNQGLDYIGVPLALSFDTIEFDIHE